MTETLELLAERRVDRVLLSSPEVGYFTRALPAGTPVVAGSAAGLLHALGRRIELRVPSGVAGSVMNERPELVLAPVGYGTVLYELAPLAQAVAAPAAARAEGSGAGGLLFPAPYSGRFWQRPSPGEPAFVKEGDLLEDGRTLGLIEVMKTFTHLVYRSAGTLPPRARLVRFLVADGGEVKDGGALLALEPA
jgi:acetyl-CoA carboxylase biotin carboxyl carrier protein